MFQEMVEMEECLILRELICGTEVAVVEVWVLEDKQQDQVEEVEEEMVEVVQEQVQMVLQIQGEEVEGLMH